MHRRSGDRLGWHAVVVHQPRPQFSLRLIVLALISLGLGGCVITGDDGDSGGGTAMANGGTAVADETGSVSCFEDNRCNPLDQECSGGKCVPTGNEFICMPTMSTGPESKEGDPCEGGLSCQDGLVCLLGSIACTGGLGCCTALCDLNQPQCPSGTVCTPYAPDTSCYADVGLCVLG